jgi:hypothetical protein
MLFASLLATASLASAVSISVSITFLLVLYKF